MSPEKRSVLLLVLTVYFLRCAFCDNDDASTMRETAITTSATESSSVDLGSTETPTSTGNYETTDTLQTSGDSSNSTDAGSDDESSSVTWTTKSIATTTLAPEDTTNSTDNSTVICDPATWPIDANADARKVFNLTVNSKSTEWIALSWEQPCPNATNTSILVVYSVERYDDRNYTQTNETVTRHNATGLDPCTQYTFAVKVITEYWTSDAVNQTETTDHTIPNIGDVSDLTHNSSVNAIALVWKPPELYARCISNYSITRCEDESLRCSDFVVSTTNYNATELQSCTKYNFAIRTVTQAVKSAGVNYTAKTTSPRLSPRSLKVAGGNFSLDVEWQPPKNDTNCLKHYRVAIEPNDSKVFNTTETNVTIPDLDACMNYQVYLSAVNENDVEGDPITKSNKTLDYKTGPPTWHSVSSANSSSISIDWTISKDRNHCLLEDVVTTCNCTGSNGTGYDIVNGFSTTKIQTRNASLISVTTVVTRLSSFTSYVCSAFTIGNKQDSDHSEPVYEMTCQDVPSEPIMLSAKNISDSWFLLTWESPTRLPGILEGFEIILEWEPLYPVPYWCPDQEPVKPIALNETLSYNYTEARAYATYTVWVRAKTKPGWGNRSESHVFCTKYGVPEAVTRMSPPIVRPSVTDTNVLDTILNWGMPCSLNGKLEGFNVSVHGTREKYDPHEFFIMHPCKDGILDHYMCSINLEELMGEYNYTFEISAKVLLIDTQGPSQSQVVSYPAGIPPQPAQNYIQAITIDPYKTRRSTTTATVLLPVFFNTNGDIKYYAVMVSMVEYNVQSTARFDLDTNDTWPDTSAWKEAMEHDFAITYQATWKKWNPYPDHIADYGQMRAIKYTIGEDDSCKDISAKTDKPMYCNGPLKPDTWYHVRMRAFTNGGYTDSDLFLIKTNSELNVTLVIGAVFGILVVGILVTMILLVRKCSPYIVLRRFLHSDMPGSPVPAPYTRKKFISQCQQLIDNPGKLSNEFRLLQTLSVDLQMPTNTACLQANRKKNRYSDILPYDFSRVKLKVIDNDPNTDYINASFIRGYTGEDEYIACQGPKEETTYDFWRMVDQYNINMIVMLTQLVEKGKEKCHQYYPTIRETFRYENMTIRCTSELDYRTHTQRTLVLQKENKKRSIIHLHFKDWPDHDIPEDFDAMINFCQIIRRNSSASKGFIVVHCSAGIGRTGTLITIDILLQQLRDNRKLDVFGTVYRLRHHRINMVQRESQYAYIYNCIKQVLKNPYFLKTYKPPPVNPVYEKPGISMDAKDTTNSDVNLVSNLEILKECGVSSTESSSGESICDHSSRASTIASLAKRRKSAVIRGLRHYKSTGVINAKTRRVILGRSRTLDCLFYKSVRDSSHELQSRESVTQESLPLLRCSRSVGVLGDSVQSVDGSGNTDD